MIKEAIKTLIEGRDLKEEEAKLTMEEIMKGDATDAQIASFLTALRMKGESITEIIAFANVMRDFCSSINPKVKGKLVDTCGTGGDKIKTFNISTASAIVTAGAGIPVAKHGNRSVTSKCGSADVLEELGVNIKLDPMKVEECIKSIGIGFMFAPIFHGAMKYASTARREIGIRTVFNLLGPLTNPANAQAQTIGVYNPSFTEKLAKTLNGLKINRAMVVHGMDGMDEISNIGETRISELKDGGIDTYRLNPEDFGVKKANYKDILGYDPERNAILIIKLLKGEDGARRDIVLMNSAAAIIVGGKADDFFEGIEIAKESIESGRAYDKLKGLVKETDGSMERLEKLERLEERSITGRFGEAKSDFAKQNRI
jgi:anthranilate phosphoribosyltransferase